MSDPIDNFHKHCDTCAQCREHPFDLCAIGRILMDSAFVYSIGVIVGKVDTKKVTK